MDTDRNIPNPGAVLLLSLFLVSCNAATLGLPGVDPDGRDFIATSVIENGQPRVLVAGTQLRLSFADGALGASAGCNHMGGAYRIEDGRLLVEAMAMTEMGCDEARHAQDDWLGAFLSSSPLFGLADGQLLLESGNTRITFEDREIAEPDLPLIGTIWTLVSIITGDAVSSIPDTAPARIRFDDHGNAHIEPGCNSGSASYQLGEGTIALGPIALTRMFCAGAAGEVEEQVLAVLGAGELGYRIEAGTLTLDAGGRGLQFSGS